LAMFVGLCLAFQAFR